MKKILMICWAFGLNAIFAQSNCVFDACYFNRDGKAPLLEIGKGFNITDVFKPTKQCFVTSPHAAKLKRTQTGQTTKFEYYYTKNEEQYNILRNQGTSGQISYLNLFSVGGSNFSSFSSSTSTQVERIVIIAKVDFGIFTLVPEPVLKPEAKNLITKGKYKEFIDFYGTHYIHGVRKESSIWIVLTKKSTSRRTGTQTGNSFNMEFSPPAHLNFKLGETNATDVEQAINSDDYAVTVEIKGPALKKESLESGIDQVLTTENPNKLAGIRDIINGAFAGISDPNQAMITQYYYHPFSLYNLSVIQWNDKKQNQLIRINENVVKVYSTKVIVEKLTSPDGVNYVSRKFDKDIADFSDKERFRADYLTAYETILPTIAGYRTEIDTTLQYLETIYGRCSNIFCSSDSMCFKVGPYEERIQLLNSKVKTEIAKMSKIKSAAWKAANDARPECEKEDVGYVLIKNVSVNPYKFYNGNEFVQVIPGRSVEKIKFKPGNYLLKAVQTSGYMVYPTVNNREILIQNACEEKKVDIGFED